MNALLAAPLTVEIVVHYRRDTPERYDVLISPVSDGDVCVRLNSPVVGVTSCRLHRWPSDGGDNVSVRAIRSVVDCFFGGPHPAPRIVGTPDWSKVTLDVCLSGEQRRRRLLLAELSADSPTHGTFVRTIGARVQSCPPVRLCPEDADAVYAVTRLALALKPAVPAVVRVRPVEQVQATIVRTPAIAARGLAAAA